MLEGGCGAASNGEVGEFEETNGGVKSCFVGAAHVGRGVDPSGAGIFKWHRAAIVFHGDDGEVAIDLPVCVEEVGEFADGHAVDDGDALIGGEGEEVGIGKGAVCFEGADGIRPVEHDEAFVVGGCCFHGVSHGGDVGVEACADVLDFEDECVDVREHFGGGFACVAVEGVDGEFGEGVDGVVDLGLVEGAVEAVLGTEECGEVDVGGLVEEVDGAAVLGIERGVIDDETDAAHVLKWGEILMGELVDAEGDGWWGGGGGGGLGEGGCCEKEC